MVDAITKSALARHLEELLIAYWHDVDFHWGENAAAHYTEDALFVSDGARYEGRDQIREFYAWRKERGERVNVHLVGNFFLKRLEDDEAEVHWICTLFAHDGPTPQRVAPPIAITRVEDIYRRDTSGEWLCRKRHWHSLFKGDIPTTQMSPEEMGRRIGN